MNRINENPDKAGTHRFYATDAHTFIYRVQDELLFYAQTGRYNSSSEVFHSHMVRLFATVGKVFRDEARYEYDQDRKDYGEDPLPIETVDHFNDHCEMMGHDIYWDEAGGWIRWDKKRTMQIFGDTNKAIRFFKSVADVNLDDGGDTFRMKYSTIGVMGRYWSDANVASFWLNKRDLGRLISKGGLNGFFKYLDIDADAVRLNTLETGAGFFTVQDALTAAGKKPTMTRDQERELMMKQHLDPDSKRKLNADAEQIDKYGGVLPAQYHAWSRTSDGVIKLGDLLKESPDGVYDEQGKHHTTVWHSSDASAFFAFPTFCVVRRSAAHHQIWRILEECYQRQSLEPNDSRREDERIQYDVTDTKFLELLKPDGYLGKIIKKHRDDGIVFIRSKIPNVLAGRVWETPNLISFWNKQSDVLQNWSNVQSMFHKFFGALRDYHVDWSERDADVERNLTPRQMTPASDISDNTFNGNRPTDDKHNTDVISKDDIILVKMLQEPERLDNADDNLLKKVQQKMHVLDPQAKAQVMRAIGDVPTHKAVQIANKLGMSVAEFNHIMHVNESSIQLRNLIPDI